MKIAFQRSDRFIAWAIVLAVAVFASSPLLQSIEQRTYDLGVALTPTPVVSDRVVLVEVDAASLDALGPWPWSADTLASAITFLDRAGAAVIGQSLPLDALHDRHGLTQLQNLRSWLSGRPGPGEARELVRGLNERLLLAEHGLDPVAALRGNGRLRTPVVQAVGRHEGVHELPPSPLGELVATLPGWMRVLPPPLSPATLPEVAGLSELDARLAGAAPVGYLPAAGNGVVRGVPLAVRHGEGGLASFALAVVLALKESPAGGIALREGPQLWLGDARLPTDGGLRLYPLYYEARNGSPLFERYSFHEVHAGAVPRDRFKDKIVLIGGDPEGMAATVPTARGAVTPAALQGQLVSSLLQGHAYRVPAWGGFLQLAVLALVGLYLALVLPRFRRATGLAFSAVLVLLLTNAQLGLMVLQAIWLPLALPGLALVAGHGVLFGKHLVEDRIRRAEAEAAEANRLLGASFQSQGQLDRAYERYRKCPVDAVLLDMLYGLGLDYERKRQFNKAGAVFRDLARHAPGYSDVAQRIKRNEQMEQVFALGAGGLGRGKALVTDDGSLQRPMLGRYELEREIGRGAMGTVYLGRDPKLNRTVAIKTLVLSEFEADQLEDLKARFFREAETAGRLDHPDIVTIHDVGEEQDLAYIAMDLLKGESLQNFARPDTLLPLEVVVETISKVAEALAHAHAQHVVHRDVKPANIVYDASSGAVKVTDFGVACVTDASRTRTGTILGSPSYMSPEQLAGGRVDGRSDLFSLGVTLYQLLTGHLPFRGDSLANIMYKIANEPHPDVRKLRPDLPSCMAKIVNKALHKDPEKRFQDGVYMAQMLRKCLSHMTRSRGKVGEKAA